MQSNIQLLEKVYSEETQRIKPPYPGFNEDKDYIQWLEEKATELLVVHKKCKIPSNHGHHHFF